MSPLVILTTINLSLGKNDTQGKNDDQIFKKYPTSSALVNCFKNVIFVGVAAGIPGKNIKYEPLQNLSGFMQSANFFVARNIIVI